MNLTVHQSIVIHSLRIESIANSSVLQIGSAGAISSLSQIHNTGGFTAPAPSLESESSQVMPFVPLVPLAAEVQ